MSTVTETSDGQLIDLLRARGPLSVAELATATGVTATAVRQRLSRLTGQGLIERQADRQGRGRPVHRYRLTEKARRQVGSNFADLALVLWKEMRSVKDPEIRRGLLERIAAALAGQYSGEVSGRDASERMAAISELLADRRIPAEVRTDEAGLPVLAVMDCPYPRLAEQDRAVCAMERMLFAELLETPVRLSECRLDGHTCCQFETTAAV